MKLLRGIRLINWHYFTNETIRVEGSTLITGDNGAGKSTILDAIQYALVGDARKVRFNFSAHEQSRRTLEGYLRCKVGREGPAGVYLRSGDFTSYVVLEFEDTRRRRPFLLGVGIDSFASGEQDDPVFFKIEDQGLDDDLWLAGDRPRSARREFRHALQGRPGATVYATAEQYRRDVRTKLGHLDERFFTVLVRAVAFTPIVDLRGFVYDYVLEPRPARVDAMRENLQQYHQFERLAQQAREKLSALERIRAQYDEVVRLEHLLVVQECVIRWARLGAAKSHEEQIARDLERVRDEAEWVQHELEHLNEQMAFRQRDLEDLQAAQAADDAFQRLRRLDEEIQRLAAEGSRLEASAASLQAYARQEREDTEKLAAMLAAEAPGWGFSPAEQQAVVEGLRAWAELWRPAEEGRWDGPVPARRLEELLPWLEGLLERLREHAAGLRQQLNERLQEMRRLQSELEDLRRQRLTYDEPVQRLRWLIFQALGVEPRVLCELLEIPNERWQNAVEGYLHTQRFDLLVPPEAFDAALAVYEREKRAHRIHGVGLVNTGALLREQPRAEPGSLAEEVVTSDPYARAYVDRLLGRVMKAEDEQELKRFRVAITPTCMTYRNHTARQIDFRVYELWYIGQRAFVRQREVKEARLRELQAESQRLEAELQRVSQCIALRSRKDPRWALERWSEALRLPHVLEEMARRRRERAEIDTASLEAILRAMERTKKEIGELEAQLRQSHIRYGQLQTEERVLEGQLRQAAEERARRQEELTAMQEADPSAWEAGRARYQEERRHRDDGTIAKNFEDNRKTLETRAQNARIQLVQLRDEYNHRYQFGGPAAAEDNTAYDEEARKLRESELPSYEEKIRQARAQAEEEFKEHFVARLREGIEEAQAEFRELSRILREIEFGQDRYEFVVEPRPDLKAFYEMLMDPLLLEGHSLFSAAFQQKYRHVLDELFGRLLGGSEEEQLGQIEFFTDYRNYLDYDIRVRHRTGDSSLYSQVAREKSGGETQTPYYVVIAASFLRIYRPGQRGGEDSARLVLFDEAFNRMDPDRAEKALRLFRQLGLQVIIGAPTDKCELLQPHLETTLLVLRDGHRAWVEPYHQVLEAAEPAAVALASAEEP